MTKVTTEVLDKLLQVTGVKRTLPKSMIDELLKHFEAGQVQFDIDQATLELELIAIIFALLQTKYHERMRAARWLRLKRTTLCYKLQKYCLLNEIPSRKNVNKIELWQELLLQRLDLKPASEKSTA